MIDFKEGLEVLIMDCECSEGILSNGKHYGIKCDLHKKKILLVDVDSKIPNLALMKLSTYFKYNGDDVSFKKLGFDYYSEHKINLDCSGYNSVYLSIIFKKNKDSVNILNCSNVYFGGTGYSLDIKLPDGIDSLEEDYSIYPDNKLSYGFITRGCIRNCYFCVVPKKEGRIYQYDSVEGIVKHKRAVFLDNNILAFVEHKGILQELVDKKIRCQFNQGLDIRLIDEENAKLLSKMNYFGEYIFAFDDLNLEPLIIEKLKILKKYILKDWKLKFFLYCHPNMKLSDILHRIYFCKKNKILPYFMRDESCWNSENSEFYIDLASWCNQPALFKKMSFEQYMQKRTKNEKRRNRSVVLFKMNSSAA